MAFNIDTFKSQGLALGGARPSLFRVRLFFPAVVTGKSAAEQESVFHVRAGQMPASTLGTVEVPYFGRKIKLAGDRTFTDWTVTIMNDEDFLLRNALEEWSNAINTLVSNRLNPAVAGNIAGTTGNYKTDLFVDQYAKDGPSDEQGIIRSYRFVGAFPTEIGTINLDWDTTNQIETFDTTFAYDYWVPEPVNTPAYSPILNPA